MPAGPSPPPGVRAPRNWLLIVKLLIRNTKGVRGPRKHCSQHMPEPCSQTAAQASGARPREAQRGPSGLARAAKEGGLHTV